jgi:hypothetical protein
MGGFVTRNGHHPIVTKAQLKQHLGGIKAIKEEDIRDKSKGDNLSKLLTLLHVVWFAAQFVERLHQGLSISKLETATVGFVFIHICTCGFWWKKPQDVSEAILIDPVSPPDVLQFVPKLKSQSHRSILRSWAARRRPTHYVQRAKSNM